MDKKKSLLNVLVSIFFKIIVLISGLIARRFLIHEIGQGVNGINSLYVSIIGFLAIAELGVGSAITYCMYKPIVKGEKEKVSALYHLFTKLYLLIGAIITIAGCLILPLLPILAKGYETADVNLYLTFGLMLVSVVITYLYGSKTSLINAYKNNYITTTVISLAQIMQNALQIIVLILTQSFVGFLLCQIFVNLLQLFAMEIIARKKYGEIIKCKKKVDEETKKEVSKNVKAMFMHKIGGALVISADNIIISAFIGVTVLGSYSNYTLIMTSMIGIISLFFIPLTSIVGHRFVKNKEESKKIFSFFYTLNFIICSVFFFGYYAIIDNLVGIFFGSQLEIEKKITFVITLNYGIQFMKQATGLFRDATGTFYNDRWKPFFEGITNVVLSILFVCIFPEDLKVVGVIVATIITNVLICHVVEPRVLFKYAFNERPNKYYVKNFLFMVLFAVTLFLLNFCMQTISNVMVELIVNGCIALAVACIPILIAIFVDRDFIYILKQFFKNRKRNKTN